MRNAKQKLAGTVRYIGNNAEIAAENLNPIDVYMLPAWGGPAQLVAFDRKIERRWFIANGTLVTVGGEIETDWQFDAAK
jgi:hypothetical protein